MSIIKPGEIRVDVLVISKVKQGLKGGREGKGWRKIKITKNFQVIFWTEAGGKPKKPPKSKRRGERGLVCLKPFSYGLSKSCAEES